MRRGGPRKIEISGDGGAHNRADEQDIGDDVERLPARTKVAGPCRGVAVVLRLVARGGIDRDEAGDERADTEHGGDAASNKDGLGGGARDDRGGGWRRCDRRKGGRRRWRGWRFEEVRFTAVD